MSDTGRYVWAPAGPGPEHPDYPDMKVDALRVALPQAQFTHYTPQSIIINTLDRLRIGPETPAEYIRRQVGKEQRYYRHVWRRHIKRVVRVYGRK